MSEGHSVAVPRERDFPILDAPAPASAAAIAGNMYCPPNVFSLAQPRPFLARMLFVCRSGRNDMAKPEGHHP